ncbi:MAG: hypothetical protein N838_13975 [Thiohalocapsa sp. PB-PSB1]|jgi:hypothetical protein|nr:MAG: hypothetical protein N838_24180 [Thiohalocapsa sp. PB-PSB1]QQO54284.1 MAG: hypothetical protein N838_13975 [Thiohalocapsa sp. PB-PSB1]HCS90371.1 hypothetical protein [Chromatiaceae bacterium]
MSKPTRLSAKIDQLKILLLNAEEFADAMNYFLDELVSDSAFSAAGKPLKDKRIKQRFRGVLQILKERLNIQSAGPPQMIATVSLKEYQLSHGAFMLGDRLGMAFYFRDLDMGLCALGALDGSGEVVFTRFSVYDQVGAKKSFHTDRSGRRH